MSVDSCEICGEFADLVEHHKIPRELGASNTSESVLMVCPRCHKHIHRYANRMFSKIPDKKRCYVKAPRILRFYYESGRFG